MSTSDPGRRENDFERWLTEAFAATGAFTALVVLVGIRDTRITPLCSTYFNVIGDEVDWSDVVVMFAGAGMDWDGAAFFPVLAADSGPLDNPTARVRLRELEMRIDNDRLVLNESRFFDKWGRAMTVEEVTA